MAHAAESVATCSVLRDHPELHVRLGPYFYDISRSGEKSIYSVSDGKRAISEPILWAFGKGEAGQTYIFKHGGSYYQSRVSFFSDTGALDLTLGFPNSAPQSLDEALGEQMDAGTARKCIGCHSTGALDGDSLDASRVTLGVHCEACHGPGSDHIAAMKAGRTTDPRITNPGKLAGGDLDDFCGTCHRTWAQVREMHLRGVNTVRFQPYRLVNSRCWDADDPRITCLACHDPHKPRVRDAAFYDAKCLRCHSTATAAQADSGRLARSCKAGNTGQCVTCHMPKYELPGGHFKFTDHMIRVVRAGEAFPD